VNIMFYIARMASGGAETLVKDYAINLHQQGHRVAILVESTCADWPNEVKIREAEIAIYSLSDSAVPGSHIIARVINKIRRISIGKWKRKKRICEYLEEFKPDVFHVHLEMLNNTVAFAKKLKKCKVFYTCHSLPEKFFSGKNKGEYNAAKYLIANNKLRMIALHQEMAEELNKLFEVSNTCVLLNPIDVKRFQNPIIEKNDMRKLLNIPEDAFVLGHIGRFSEVKNQRWIVEVFREVKKNEPKAYLLLIGAGALKQQIEQQLEEYGLRDCYQILSNRGDIPELGNVMDVFIMPSLYEGIPITLLEVQALGLPSVISDSIPNAAVLSENIAILSLEESVDQWCRAVLTLKDSRTSVRREDLIWNHDIQNVTAQLIDIYGE